MTDDGQVKLLDFGIAKVLEEDAVSDSTGDGAPITKTGAAVMTPAYASPEQVRGEPVGTSTDIYSLGVVLYELLTGLRPYDVSSKNPLEAAQIVCEVDPAAPSSVVSEERTSSSTTYGSDTGRIRRLLAGDLDVVCLKALRKEPERRYTTSDELGEDIRRHLAGRPIEARAESWTYRTGKFVRRNKAVVGLVMLGLILTAFYTIRVADERNRAQQEAEKARLVSDFLKQVFSVSDPAENLGETLTAREILDQGAERMEADLESQPEILAEMLHIVGDVYRGIGLFESSVQMHARGLAIREEMWGASHPEVANSQAEAALAHRYLNDYATADSLFRTSIETRRSLFGRDDLEAARAQANLGYSRHVQGDYSAAESLLVDVLNIREESFDLYDLELDAARHNLATTYARLDRYREADSLYALSIETLRREHGDDHPYIAIAMRNRAATRRQMGDAEMAEALYRGSLEMRRRLYPAGHPSIGAGASSLGGFLVRQERYDEAKPLLIEAHAVQMEALGPTHPRRLAVVNNLSKLYEKTGNFAAADSLRQIALEGNRVIYGDVHPRIASDLAKLADIRYLQGFYDESASIAREAIEMRIAVLGDKSRLLAGDLTRLGKAELALGNQADARRLFEKALGMGIDVMGEEYEHADELRLLIEEASR